MKKHLEQIIDLLLIVLCAALGCYIGLRLWEVTL